MNAKQHQYQQVASNPFEENIQPNNRTAQNYVFSVELTENFKPSNPENFIGVSGTNPTPYVYPTLEELKNRKPRAVQNPFTEPDNFKTSQGSHFEGEDYVHVIKDGDSIMGLSLTYGVTQRAIRKANGLATNDIYFLKQVVIPKPKRIPEIEQDDGKLTVEKQNTVRNAFINRTGEKDHDIVNKYIEEANYDYTKSLDLYYAEKHKIEEEKRKISELINVFDKDDKCPKVARYYLSESNWDVRAAAEMYKGDCIAIMRPQSLEDFLNKNGGGSRQVYPESVPLHIKKNQ